MVLSFLILGLSLIHSPAPQRPMQSTDMCPVGRWAELALDPFLPLNLCVLRPTGLAGRHAGW